MTTRRIVGSPSWFSNGWQNQPGGQAAYFTRAVPHAPHPALTISGCHGGAPGTRVSPVRCASDRVQGVLWRITFLWFQPVTNGGFSSH